MPTVTIKLVIDDVIDHDLDYVIEVRPATSCRQAKGDVPESFGGNVAMFLQFMQSLIDELEVSSIRTAEAYRHARNQLKEFLSDEDIPLRQITAGMMEKYERYLKGRNLSLNTISFHMRILRAVYNKAVEKGLAEDLKVFKHVYTGIAKTQKRAIALQDIIDIKNYQTKNNSLAYARDMFLFSFYTRGMSFVDMAYLKTANLNNGWLSYRRHKTGQPVTMRWEPLMEEIVSRLPPSHSPFLLPIIHTMNGKERSQYRNKQNLINRNLKVIAQDISLHHNLTMYVARHSWASIAEANGLPLSLISLGMGHTSEKTTQIYLKSLKQNKIDEANEYILSLLNKS